MSSAKSATMSSSLRAQLASKIEAAGPSTRGVAITAGVDPAQLWRAVEREGGISVEKLEMVLNAIGSRLIIASGPDAEIMAAAAELPAGRQSMALQVLKHLKQIEDPDDLDYVLGLLERMASRPRA